MDVHRLIEIVPYNPLWPQQFAMEAGLIKKALGENCVEIFHIGSTSVPGLAAKPVIDMISVVQNIAQVDLKSSAMLDLSYTARGENGIPFRRYFQKGTAQPSFNVHVFEQGNPEIERHLKFCEWMRAHPNDRQQYADLKIALA